MTVIPFAEWRPDMPALSQWSQEALNVVPAEESYRPLNSFASVTNALTARCQGGAWFRGTGGLTKMFAGDATKLYLLSNVTWSDVSRVAGGAYATPADSAWRFAQFGTTAIAVNGLDAPQSFDLASGTNWIALAGSPPVGTFITTVLDFVVMGKIGSTPQRVQWSGINNANLWGSVPSSQADIQDLPDGGNVTGLVGGEFGLVFSETSIRRMTYEGPPVIFRFAKISNDLGCSVPGSVASLLNKAFFLHKSGFYMVDSGQTITPIGRGKVDRYFWADFDETNQSRVSAAIDPVRGLYVISYPANGNGGTPNRVLIYNWFTQKWARVTVTTEIIFSGVSQQSYTIEQLDAFGTLETLPYSLDSSYWTGVLSLLLFAFDTSHKSGSFSGPTMAAEVQTAEFKPLDGQRAVVRGVRPLIDGGSPQISIGSRDSQQVAATFGTPVGLTPAGLAPVRRAGRYFRVKATTLAGASWSNMQGIDDIDARAAGLR